MNYYIATDRFGNYDLEHHGIKGQKWGVRRYQNPDGSLTPAGEKRYGSSYVKGLNRLSGDIAETKRKRALNNVKIADAKAQKKKEKAKELEKLDKDLEKSISAGEKLIDKYVREAKQNGVSIGSRKATIYASSGKRYLTAHLIGGLPADLVVGGVDIYRARRYGNEAGGFVEGNEYYLKKR